VGGIVYTQWLNIRGGIEADLTVTRLTDQAFLLVTPGATVARDLAWLKRQMPTDAQCVVTDITPMETVICLMGPKSREVLAQLTSAPLDNEAFPFGTAQTIDLGMASARAHRISYVGELGWEIYVTADFAAHVYEQIVAAGEAHGLRLCGLHVLDSCRIEKAFRHFGHDITDEDHVLEAGLGFAVKTDKPAGRFGDFIGRDAVLAKHNEGLSRRLVQFQLNDPEPLLYHTEPIVRDGEIVGHVTSGSYGHWLGGAIGLGYVPVQPGETGSDLLKSSFEIEVAGKRVAATASLNPLYDAKAERVRM